MAKLLFHIAFVDSAEEARPARREWPANFSPFAFGKIAADASRERRRFDEARDMAVVEPVGADMPAAIDHAAKEGPGRCAQISARVGAPRRGR